MTHWNLPRDKNHPSSAVQCGDCGGWGYHFDDPCTTCEGRGWLEAGHARGRHCHRDGCGKPIPPSQIAVYCSNECAAMDA